MVVTTVVGAVRAAIDLRVDMAADLVRAALVALAAVAVAVAAIIVRLSPEVLAQAAEVQIILPMHLEVDLQALMVALAAAVPDLPEQTFR